jgi:DNA ligase-1
MAFASSPTALLEKLRKQPRDFSSEVDMEVLLAKPWTGQDPTGYWMSEKLDGVRAVWQGGEFRSRNGNVFHAPESFRAKMPPYALDGELFMGRGEFQTTVSIVRSHTDKGWDRIRFHVFDLYPIGPNAEEMDFEMRQRWLTMILAGPVVHVPQVRCEGAAHLTAFVDAVIAGGGEGAMLRAPGSLYEKKRSATLLKVKRFHDIEARVTGHVPGKGKHVGRLGALSCVAPNGAAFEVGTGFTDAERAAPPAVGESVTVRFQELTKDGIPRFPVYVVARDYE